MTDRTSRGPIAVVGAVLALSLAAALIAWGTGSWTGSPGRVGGARAIVIQTANGPETLSGPLGIWCAVQPGSSQAALSAGMGIPMEASTPGRGHEIGLNITPGNELSLVITIVPMHRSDGFAVWRRDGYLLADTFATSGSILRMYAWEVGGHSFSSPSHPYGATERLGCPAMRGRPFGPVTVPNVLGQTVTDAESELSAANLTPSIPAISNVWLRSAPVRLQNPAAGTSVAPGTAVRLNPYLHGVLCFVYCGLTLQPTGGIATLGVSKDEAIAIYRQHSPGPSGAPTAVLLGYMSSHRGAGPRMHHWLVWVVEYKHAPIPLYGPQGGTAIGTWIGVIDVRTGRYLTTQNFG